MDKDDWQIVAGVLLAAFGIGWAWHPGVGLFIAGVALMVPFFLSRTGKGE